MTNVATSTQVITGATYDPANRLLTISGNLSESRTYNSMGQLTQLSSNATTNSLNITYNYSSTQNNGKITSQTDNLSGEQVVYAYDTLNRLASAGATNNSWGQSYAYDGFGNLTDQNVTAGTAPSMHTVYNASTNRQTSDCADANGNIIGCGQPIYAYDVENRMHPVATTGASSFYSYAPGNKRVWRGATNNSGTQTLDEVTFWSVTGQKLGTYNLSPGQATYQNGQNPQWILSLNATVVVSNVYFGGKLISNGAGNIVQDRLGSVGKFYPWGQEKPSATANGTEKFTGYFRDAETGLDYADQRYHQPGMGRFVTVDPDMGSAHPEIPSSWSRYSYVGGDPVNFSDPTGLDGYCGPHGTWMGEGCYMSGNDTGAWGASLSTTMGGPCTNGNVLSLLNPTTLIACQIYAPLPPKPSPPPQPTCTLAFESRGLVNDDGTTSGPSLHGYLYFTSSIGTAAVIEGGTPDGGQLVGKDTPTGIAGDNPARDTNTGSISGDWVCALRAILDQDVARINGAHIAYNAILGPNSNSALRYFVDSIQGIVNFAQPTASGTQNWYTVPFGMWVFGWNTALPGLN